MRRFLALLAILIPGLAAAQTVPVRSGDHDGFTRLVFDLPAETEWRLERAGTSGGYDLTLGSRSWSFDLSRAFDRIGRDRIAGIDAGNGTVRIDLACACEARAFRLGDRMLVVDVLAALPSREKAPQAVVRDVLPLFLPGDSDARNAVLSHPLLPRFDPGTEAARVATLEPSRGEIVSRVARAAASGILTPSIQPFPSPVQPSVPPATATLEAETAKAGPDIAFSDRDGRLVASGRDCVPDALLGFFAEPVPDAPSPDILSDTRARLYGEFDRIDPDAIRDHARQLLQLGFGAEARSVLSLAGDGDDAVLKALSYLVDGQEDPDDLFRDQSACPGAASFWALLSGHDAEAGLSVDVNAVLRTFESMPQHLKAHLGPGTAERFEVMGLHAAARSVLRRTERALGGSTPETALLAARLDMAEGATDAAAASLSRLVSVEGPVDPDALVALVGIAEQEGAPVPQTVVEMAGALATERRHDETGPELWRAHVAGLVANGDFDRAFLGLSDARDVGSEMRDRAAEATVAALVRDAEDQVFLKYAFSGEVSSQGRKPPIAVSVASRLLELGLAQAALDILAQAPAADWNGDTRLLAARANLALREPERAEILLIGLQDDAAARLRGQARAMMGDHAGAAEIFTSLDDPDAAREASWLAGNWSALAAPEGDAMGRAAHAAAGPKRDIDTAGPSLTQAEAVAREAALTRDLVLSLLTETSVSVVQDSGNEP